MFCSLSGVLPTHPVVSKKSGHLFERSVIEAHIKDKGVCPVTAQPLQVEDLLPVPIAPCQPRTTTTTSFPALLEGVQTEWDAIMLEQFNLRKTVESLRYEVSKGKYQVDAATRVIARLVQERDAAKASLADMLQHSGGASVGNVSSNASTSGGSSSSSVEMKAFGFKVAEEFEVIKKKRPTRTMTKHAGAAVSHVNESNVFASDIKDCRVAAFSGNLILAGGANGQCSIADVRGRTVVQKFSVGGVSVEGIVVCQRQGVFVTVDAEGIIRVWSLVPPFQNTGPKTIATYKGRKVSAFVIPRVDNYLLVGCEDGTIGVTRLDTGASVCILQNVVQQSSVSSIALHPDGALLAVAAGDSVTLLDLRSLTDSPVLWSVQQPQASHGSQMLSVAFSQNGYQLVSGTSEGALTLWDIRKSPATVVSTKMFGSPITSVSLDCSGLLLAAAHGSEVSVTHTKTWSDSKVVSKQSCGVVFVGWSDSDVMSSSEVPSLVAVVQDGRIITHDISA